MFSVQNQMSRRTIHVRLSGLMSQKEMTRFAAEYVHATDSYQGEFHLVLADMRGLKTCSPPVAAILMEAIGYARKRGVAACAHISDDTVTRLQMLRLGRKVSEDDDVTVDVVSLEEAESVLSERRFDLLIKGGPVSSSKSPGSASIPPVSSSKGPGSASIPPVSSSKGPGSASIPPVSSSKSPEGDPFSSRT
jgi:hypothetical protein